MQNLANLDQFDSQVLSLDEMHDVNGGVVCGGLCIAGAVVAGAAVVAFAVGVYNGYNNAG